MKLPSPLALQDGAVDLAGLLTAVRYFCAVCAQVLLSDLEGLVGSLKLNAPEQLRMPLAQSPRFRPPRGLADKVGHVDGVEVASIEKAVDGVQRDVVGVAEVGQLPAERLHRGVGGLARSRPARNR